MPGLIETLETLAPGVSLRVVPLSTRDPRRLLDDEEADLAVGYFPAALADLTARAQVGKAVAFAHQRLYGGQYVCVMRRDHPRASGPFTLNRFCAARHLLVSFSGRPFGFIDEALATLGRERRVVLTVNQFFTAGRVVTSSDLLSVMPHHFVGISGMADNLVVRELPFTVPPIQVNALWHLREQHSSAHMWLRQIVSDAASRAFPA